MRDVLKPGITPWQFLFAASRGYRLWLFGLVAVVLVASSSVIAESYIIREIINLFTGSPLPAGEKFSIAIKLVAIQGAITLTAVTLWRVSAICGMRSYPNMVRETRLALFEYLSKHNHRYLSENFAGALANKVSTAGRATQDIIEMFSWDFVPQGSNFFYTFVLFYFIHPTLAFVALGIGMTFFAFFFIFGKRVSELGRLSSDARSTSHGKLVDSVTNMWNISSFARGAWEIGYLDSVFAKEQKTFLDSWKYREVIRFGQALIMYGTWIGMTALIVYYWSVGLVTVGDIAIVFTLSSGMMRSARDMSFRLIGFMERVSDIEDALRTIVIPYDVADAAKAPALAVTDAEIEFRNVDFRYREGLPNVFTDLSFVIRPHERVGLVGRSGAGKTTIVALLQRMYDVTGGAILIDGQPIADASLDSLRRAISVVPQDPVLFHRSLRDNIAYGKPDATDEEVYEAARRAHAHEFIRSIPEGYAAKVGERGVKLSGGQRQRVAIARAILKDAPILILDEATSALDSESEELIQDALWQLMKGRTTIVIAHRLSTLKNLDRIVVFDQGRIVEEGAHDALIAKRGGLYRDLWERQVGGFISEE